MRFNELKGCLLPLGVFSLQDIYLVDPSFRQPTLYEWKSKGLVTQLRRNYFMFSDAAPRNADYYMIANKVYQPSYVSLELALNHYGIIPELVQMITSVTTLKTRSFNTPIAVFDYRSINKKLFFGYKIETIRNRGVQLATLEKAILDFLYLRPRRYTMEDFEELRWHKNILKKQLNRTLLSRYLVCYENKALCSRLNTLLQYLK